MILDATVGSPQANSYVTMGEATDYFGSFIGRDWFNELSLYDRSRVLISSSRLLDMYTEWYGTKTTSDQALGWPRNNVQDVDNNVIPQKVKYAVYELAQKIHEQGGFLEFSTPELSSAKIGPISIELAKSSTELGIPKYIRELVRWLGEVSLFDSGVVLQARLIRS